MEVGDKTVNLTAKKVTSFVDKHGVTWYKGWHLTGVDTLKVYGVMVYNSHWTTGKHYSVTIYSQIHTELGAVSSKEFVTKEEALTWAREQIEDLREPTFNHFQEALERIKNYRYQDEMSDDFTFSNGTIARWDRIEREVRTKMEKVA